MSTAVSSAITAYLGELQSRLAQLGASQESALGAAAEACAEALANRNIIHLHDTGHLISHEMIARTGGLAAYTAFTYGGALNDLNLHRAAQGTGPATLEEKLAAERALLDWVFAQGTLRAGDVLIAGSVSGTGWKLVELALQAKQRGLTVIAVTAPAHSSRLAAQHPSGLRLFEAADIVLDNGAQYGDSFFQVDGFDTPICPISGIGAAVLMWALTAGIVERLVRRGLKPSVYTSVNLPGGPAAVEQVEAAYSEQGY
jgi:uncharacterized phosphosugar-binding protein